MKQKGILLESGTGELEVLEFVVDNKHYAINVIKTKEIFEVKDIIKIPNSSKAVAGVSLVRGETMSLIDMRYVLENKEMDRDKKNMVLSCEFNNMKVGFLIDKVLGIHRIGWNDIKEPDSVVGDSLVIGNIVLEDKVLMLLDFEKIVLDLTSSKGSYEGKIEKVKHSKERGKVKLILADDSKMIREMLKGTLTAGGYTDLTFFDNGEEAYRHLLQLAEEKGEGFKENVDILITDIEMPKMDGHTLTRKIKEHNILKDLPVLIFSSLITDDLHHKGKSVGADEQISKPNIDSLIEIVDKYTLHK